MLKIILLSIILASNTLTVHSTLAQRCNELNSFSTLEIQELEDYVASSEKQGYFIYNKGIVGLYNYIDTLSQKNWILGIEQDDRYKENIPSGWVKIHNRIVLVYQIYIDSWWNKGTLSVEDIECFEKLVSGQLEKDKINKPAALKIWQEESLNLTHVVFLRNGQIDRY